MQSSKPFSSVRKQRATLSQRVLEFLLEELIGEKIRVADSSCRELLGLEGVVVDETLSTFVVRTPRGFKKIPKKGTKFFFPSRGALVDGSILYCKPEDRTKKLFKQVMRRC